MGRNVIVRARVGGAAIHEIMHGSVELEPTILRRDNSKVIYPARTMVGLANGLATFVGVEPSPDGPTPEWAYKVTVRDAVTGRVWSEIVGVPEGSDPINYSRLPRYSTILPPDTTPEQLQNWADTAQDGAVRAEAAAEAAVAPTDETLSTLLAAPSSQASRTLSGQMDLRQNPAMGVLLAAYTRALSEPIGIVNLGSSSTAGTDQVLADRWVNKLCAAMQTNYAAGPGANTAPGNLASPRIAMPGIHFYNGGLSGANTGTYLTAAKVSQIQALAPVGISHMIGSNDAKDNMPASTYRANLLGWMDAIDAVLPNPHVHILIHAHQRSDSDITTRWDEYREVLRNIAKDRPTTAIFLDISRDYEAIGFPFSDPLDFLKEDLVHLTQAGHDFTARILAEHLKASSRIRPTTFADSFTRSNGALGMADSGQRWLSSPGSSFEISGNQVAINTGGNITAECGSADVHVSGTITHTGEDNSLVGLIARANHATGARLGLFITAGVGQLASFYVNDGTTNTEVWREPIIIAPGVHVLDLVIKGNACAAYVDGELIKAFTLPSSAAGLANNTGIGYRSGAASASIRLGRIMAKAA